MLHSCFSRRGGVVVATAMLVASVARAEELPANAELPASATLPLKQILDLYRERDALQSKDKDLPPKPAAVERIEMRGRLLEDAIEIDAKVAFVVMQADKWVRLPLIKIDDSLQLIALTQQENVTLIVDQGELALYAKGAGRNSVDFRLRVAATYHNDARRARVELACATTAELLLSYDSSVFDLQASGQVRESDGVRYFSRARVLSIVWRQRSATVLQNLTLNDSKLPTEPLIHRAYATLVSTLEGEFLLRLKYVMHLTGQQSLQLTLPAGDEVRRVYLNGVAIAHKVDNSIMVIEVSHRRAGDEEAVVELVIARPQQSYVLSGRLDIELPQASWTINALQVQLYLPEVFNYRWAGGSLAQIEQADSVTYTASMPTPGKLIAFEQILISTTRARLSVDYFIDLTDKYFRGR